jgi:LuxR family transcriptional regulator, maltose regulon positive regulatory protein
MSERSDGIASDGAASGLDVLLATKLHLPHPRAGFVSRPRLLTSLDEAPVPGVVLVCAPAGFGKTALVGDWARRGGRPVAWLSLDAGDSDPARFWRHVVVALGQARPGIAARVSGLLGPPAPPSCDGLVAALINELAAGPDSESVRLVLDDYHLIESGRVHALLTFLLEHLPPGLQLVLASRADPPLGLARLRVLGQLTELRAADLRCTPEEASALLQATARRDLPPSSVAALDARTDGWAAGLQLAALSLQGHGDVAAFVATFGGSHRYVLDYLTEEVLDRQSDLIRHFLLQTSILDRLSGALCDAVTGRGDGQAMLEAAEAAGLFLVPLDEQRAWWRYHPLFADLLRARLRQERPEQVADLHRAAARWHEEHGLADDAVRHAMAGGDPACAARLIEEQFDALFYQRGEGATVQRWLSALPADLAQTRPRLMVAQAALADAAGRVDVVEEMLVAAEAADRDSNDETYQPSSGRASSMLVNVPATIAIFRAYLAELRGDATATAASAARARVEVRDGEWMLKSIAEGHAAAGEWLAGRLAEAERGLVASIGRWREAGNRNLAGWGSFYLGQVQRGQGRLDAASATYQQTLDITTTENGRHTPGAGIGYVGLAEVAYQRNQLDAAADYLAKAIPLCRLFTFTPPLATALVTLAWTRQATGDTRGGRDAMDEALRISPAVGKPGPLNPVGAQHARLLLVQGDIDAARRWADERGFDPHGEVDYAEELAYLVLARVMLGQDRAEQSLALLTRMHTLAVAQRRVGSVIELRALRALALASGGDDTEALDSLADALALASADGYVRVFIDEGARMRTLLGRLLASQRSEDGARAVPLGYLARLFRAFDSRPATSDADAATVAGLVEPLTRREVEVLSLMATGKSNRRIADDLVVTLDTVKKHVSHVMDKLGAANRTEAVVRGRELGLIS